jgi:hypothetical protein
MAVSPHHPLSYFAVNVAMQRLFEEQNIGECQIYVCKQITVGQTN